MIGMGLVRISCFKFLNYKFWCSILKYRVLRRLMLEFINPYAEKSEIAIPAVFLIHTTLQRKSYLCILRKGIALPQDQTNFHIHVSMSDLYILRIDPRIFLQQNRRRPMVGIYTSLTDTWIWGIGTEVSQFHLWEYMSLSFGIVSLHTTRNQ